MITEPPTRLVFEQLSRNMPPERAADFFRIFSRLREMNSNDDLVVLVEAFSLCTVLSRDTPEQLASERYILIQQLDERIERCQNLLHETSVSLIKKHDGAERELYEARNVYQRAISDFRRHIDARAARAEEQMKEVTDDVRLAQGRISFTAEQLNRHLDDLKGGWLVKLKYATTFFLFGLLCAILMKK